jgi:hypothetical protein
LIAASVSQRRTVDGEIAAVIPRVTASAASSALLQRDKGVPLSAGRVQASAVTQACSTAVNRRGLPER